MHSEALSSAAVSLEEIVSKDPSSALYLPLAERWLARGRVADALRLCEERRSRPGKGVGDHIVLGRCYLADGRLSEARDEFRNALDLDRENVVALKSLAGILSHDGRHAEAADLYRAVCRVDAGDLESQSALHQITSGEYPEVRPPEVVVGQGDLTWQPVRLTREEDHLSELALGLRTLDPVDAGLRPSPILPGDTKVPPPVSPEPLLSADEITVGPRFPQERGADVARDATLPARDPRRMEVVVPADAAPDGGLHHRLGSLDVGEFKESALDRLEDAFRPIEVRSLGEVESMELGAADLEPEPARPEVAASPTRSAVWSEPSPAPAASAAAGPVAPSPAAADPAVASPVAPAAASPDTTSDELPPAVPAGNRAAFESWLARLGGKR
jgi:tetratricopeptide (TPR) repeat protein